MEPIVLPWKCHSRNIMKLCADCNNCTKFQFYTEKVFGDIPSFVNFVSYALLKDHTKVETNVGVTEN